MFGMGFWEVCVVLLIALIVLGPKRLPVVAKTIGSWLAQVRAMANGIKTELDQGQASPEETADQTIEPETKEPPG